jgi:hypothetical protein
MGALLQETRPEQTQDEVLSHQLPDDLLVQQPAIEDQQSTDNTSTAMPTPILYFSYFFFAAATLSLIIGLWIEFNGK